MVGEFSLIVVEVISRIRTFTALFYLGIIFAASANQLLYQFWHGVDNKEIKGFIKKSLTIISNAENQVNLERRLAPPSVIFRERINV